MDPTTRQMGYYQLIHEAKTLKASTMKTKI